MKILSITTSSSICGVAILENTNIIKEINIDNGLTHSEILMPTIEQIFKDTNLTLNDIDLFVCDIGPGSFTGIRIGISTIKAFIDSTNKPSIGVNSLEALNLNIKIPEIVCSIIDAKKDNVYVEIIENSALNYIIKKEPTFINIYDLLKDIKETFQNYNLTFVGDGAINYKNIILENLPNSKFINNNTISASNVAIAGFMNYQTSNFTDITPLYLRKTQAEQNNN